MQIPKTRVYADALRMRICYEQIQREKERLTACRRRKTTLNIGSNYKSRV